MTKIRVLADDVARQIAAGEVVERPASVVKELVENALDAGATSISVRTAGAGAKLIEVSDNGSGMSAEDVVESVKSFSTSKISGADDLFRIRTYGFRGEALASISAVSRFEIVSADRADGEGWRLRIEGKTITDNAPAPHEKGTTVRVRDLFFNTPARKKFLKSATTERRRIVETLLSFALIDPELELHYSEDGRRVLDLVRNRSWRERLASILGASTMDHMSEVRLAHPPMQLSGFVSLPTHTRSNRNHQFLFVNRRLVREKTIIQAVQDSYRTVIPYRRFPVVVLSIEIPVEEVDVNVHPTKLEVRLNNPRGVFEAVRRVIKQGLSARAEATRDVGYADGVASGPPGHTPASPQPTVVRAADAETATPFPARPGRTAGETYEARVRDAYSSYMEGSASRREFHPQLSFGARNRKATPEAKEPGDSVSEKLHGEESLFWQFNNSYIFIQVRGGIVVIDQHAAHERIIHDTSKRRLANDIPVSQQILFPIHLELTLAELEVYRSAKDTIEKLGFHVEPFGGKSILVRGYPQGLKNWNEGQLLRQVFDDILQDRYPGETHSDRIIASFACRSAIRAGEKLSVQQMKTLADQLFAVPNPYSCPHGRPTIQRISLEEIEGWFLRR